MTKKKQAEPSAQTVEVRADELPSARPKHADYSRVTNALLATPGHCVPCDQADCDRDAVCVMGDTNSRYVRCERHLNYGGGE